MSPAMRATRRSSIAVPALRDARPWVHPVRSPTATPVAPSAIGTAARGRWFPAESRHQKPTDFEGAVSTLTPAETSDLLHTALHATRDAIQTIQEDERLTPDNLFVARDCLGVAVKAARGGPYIGRVGAAWHALAAGDVSTTEAEVADVLERLHADEVCGLGGDRRLPPRIELFANLEQRIQGVVMKHQRPERFVFVPVVIISFPEYAARMTTVYGVFSVDAWAIQQGKPCFVKQDFLVHQPRDDDVQYYGGGVGSRPIQDLCKRFGARHYGCEEHEGQWRCADHWYCDEADRLARVPREPVFRQALDRAIAAARGLAPSATR